MVRERSAKPLYVGSIPTRASKIFHQCSCSNLNTSWGDAIAIGLSAVRYGLRVVNFLGVSDSPTVVNKYCLMNVLRECEVDGLPIFGPANPKSDATLEAYMAFADS